MIAFEKVNQLRQIIINQLTPLIDGDYYLLELPYYQNIGDTLIWQGELDFLKTIPHKCLGSGSLWTFKFPKIKKNAVILLQGGGNFGDLYEIHHQFKMKVVETYPENKIIFFPQSVWFECERNFEQTMKIMSQHANLYMCARDSVSYKMLKDRSLKNVLLLPDMAFCINIKKWDVPDRGEKKLLLKRLDGEFKASVFLSQLEKDPNIDVTDWPTMLPIQDKKTKYMLKFRHPLSKRTHFLADFYAYHVYRKHLINTGVSFLRSHGLIYTTRLHTAILSVLLGKQVYFLDNSYGKNKNFYSSWLYDCDCVKMVEND